MRVSLLCLLIAGLRMCAARAEACPTGGVERISILAAANIDPEWARSVAGYVHRELLVDTEAAIEEAPPSEGGGDAAASDALLRLHPAVDSNHVRLVVLDDPDTTAIPGLTMLEGERAAVINLAAGRPAAGTADAPPLDVWRPRVERLFMFAGGRLLGLSVCPLPLCVLNDDMSDNGMDMKSRGLCPPCQDALRQRLGRTDLVAPAPID